ncbi:MAG: hypothetical protein ABL858_01945 [Candidatus Nitrotoga sp.]
MDTRFVSSGVPLTDISTCTTKNELISVLRNFDITVPLRTEGRMTHHAERWTICRLLSTLAENECLSYPVSLTHRDRPDFLLQYHGMKVGIEATEAISEQYACYQALAEREFPDSFLEPGHFRWGSPKRTTEEMRKLLRQEQLSSPPWAGDHAEREWALYFQSVIEAKLLKLAKPGFEKFHENWLAIYDNLEPPQIHLERAIGFLLPELERMWTSIPSFHAIYIEHKPVVVKITPNETTYLVLCDLW